MKKHALMRPGKEINKAASGLPKRRKRKILDDADGITDVMKEAKACGIYELVLENDRNIGTDVEAGASWQKAQAGFKFTRKNAGSQRLAFKR